jgi:hypothetical protein
MTTLCGDRGIELFCKELNVAFEITYKNEKGHRIVKTEKESYYVVFKERWYETFGKYYLHDEPVGESLNEEAIKRALQHNAETLVFIHPEGIYFAYTKMFLGISEKYGLIRQSKKKRIIRVVGGKRVVTPELLYSVPQSTISPFEVKAQLESF